MTKIKLCGMWRNEDIAAVNEILPEYTGFVFWEKSHRYVTKERAKELKEMLDERILATGVFLDADISTVSDIAKAGVIDVIQLHGHEDDEYIKDLRNHTDKPIIKAFSIKGKSDPESILKEAQDSPADYIMIDSGAGSGETFDWGILKDVDRPYFLAGGLSADNVVEAIGALHPFAVDVSSGLETDRVKDPEKMNGFAAAVRAAGDR